MRAVSDLLSSSGAMEEAARPILALRTVQAWGIVGSTTVRVSWAKADERLQARANAAAAFILIIDYQYRCIRMQAVRPGRRRIGPDTHDLSAFGSFDLQTRETQDRNPGGVLLRGVPGTASFMIEI